ncbi:MAG: ATP-binding protein [Oscillospiraceae bacterium]|nr:ATP-binding protein [Oscillospiraceae bacterium]
MDYIRRDKYLNMLIDRKGNGLVKVITGIRRCGKSFLLFEIFYNYLLESGVKSENIITIALDDDRYSELRDCGKLSEYIRSKIADDGEMYYVLIDEVQYAITRAEMKNPEEIRLYNVLNGLMRLKNVDIYVTGSNSKLLSRDVMTAFRGRGDTVEVYPLTFKEYYDYVGGDRSEAYENYSLYGGMPFTLFRKSDEDKARYLSELFTEVYFKDIVERYGIKLPEILGELTDDLCSSVGSLTNPSKIARTIASTKGIKVDSETVSSYLNCLTESFLFRCAKRYDVKGKKYFDYPSKYYCADVGLRNSRLNFRQQEPTHIMENIIYNELIYRGYSVDVGVVPASNGASTCEIDFVANMGSRRIYIQSAFSVDSDEKAETELRSLRSVNDFFKKVVVSGLYGKAWYDEQGILHMGLYEFFLNENSLNI